MKNQQSANYQLKLIVVTPLFMLLSHYLAVFPHEYSHSFMAWILGDKDNPLLLTYGGWGWQNLLLLSNIDENVAYLNTYNAGHPYHVALIAFAGSGFANVALFILSNYLLNLEKLKNKVYCYYFVFWFNLMNLGNFYDYVPIRTFAKNGDVYIVVTALNISAWLVYIVFGYLVGFFIWRFFTDTLMKMYKNLNLTSNGCQVTVLICITSVLFGYFGRVISAWSSTTIDPISYFLSMTSLAIIPMVVIACWPKRQWVQHNINR